MTRARDPATLRKRGRKPIWSDDRIAFLKEWLAKREGLDRKAIASFNAELLQAWWTKFPYHLADERPKEWPAEPLDNPPTIEVDPWPIVEKYAAEQQMLASLKQEMILAGEKVREAWWSDTWTRLIMSL